MTRPRLAVSAVLALALPRLPRPRRQRAIGLEPVRVRELAALRALELARAREGPAAREALLGRADDPDVLHAERLAGPEDGAVVVSVDEALEHDDDLRRAPRQHGLDAPRDARRVVGALERDRRGLPPSPSDVKL